VEDGLKFVISMASHRTKGPYRVEVYELPHRTKGLYQAEAYELPTDMTQEQKDRLLSDGAEFLMLKYWYSVKTVPLTPHRIIAMLISRKGETAQRLGCMVIEPEVWETGSPHLETVILE
jgi:hypothetical protein